MPLPRAIARLNRNLTNRLMMPLARVTPGFGVVRHRGRRTGRVYETPVNVVLRNGEAMVALVYGEGSDWVRNLLAIGEGELRVGGRWLPLREPRVVGASEVAGVFPVAVRPILRVLDVGRFLVATVDDSEGE